MDGPTISRRELLRKGAVGAAAGDRRL